MELELLEWADGALHLTFEDRLYGDDRDFILKADGTVVEVEYLDHDAPYEKPVDLVVALRQMYEDISKRS